MIKVEKTNSTTEKLYEKINENENDLMLKETESFAGRGVKALFPHGYQGCWIVMDDPELEQLFLIS